MQSKSCNLHSQTKCLKTWPGADALQPCNYTVFLLLCFRHIYLIIELSLEIRRLISFSADYYLIKIVHHDFSFKKKTTQQTCSQSKDTHSWSQTQSEENPSDTVHVVRSVRFSPLSPNCFPETLSSKRTGCCALSRCKYFYQYSNNINVGIPGCIFTIKAAPLGFSCVMLVDKQLFTHLHENNNNANNAGIGETDLYQVRVANLDHIVLVFYFEKQHQFPASAASFTAQMQLELCSSAFQSQAGSPNTHKYVLW